MWGMFKAFSLIFSLCSHSPKISLDLVLRMVSSKCRSRHLAPFPSWLKTFAHCSSHFTMGNWPLHEKDFAHLSSLMLYPYAQAESAPNSVTLLVFCCSHSFPLPTVCMWAYLNPSHLLVSAYWLPSPGSLYLDQKPHECAHSTPQT